MEGAAAADPRPTVRRDGGRRSGESCSSRVGGGGGGMERLVAATALKWKLLALVQLLFSE